MQCDECRFCGKQTGSIVLLESRWKSPKVVQRKGYACRRALPTANGFPAVRPDDWCGEFQPKESKAVTDEITEALENFQPDPVCVCGRTSEGVCRRCGQDMKRSEGKQEAIRADERKACIAEIESRGSYGSSDCRAGIARAITIIRERN